MAPCRRSDDCRNGPQSRQACEPKGGAFGVRSPWYVEVGGGILGEWTWLLLMADCYLRALFFLSCFCFVMLGIDPMAGSLPPELRAVDLRRPRRHWHGREQGNSADWRRRTLLQRQGDPDHRQDGRGQWVRSSRRAIEAPRFHKDVALHVGVASRRGMGFRGDLAFLEHTYTVLEIVTMGF